MQPLRGLKILDLTHYIAGPYCTKLLADFGAEVIKVEPPGCGDPARNFDPFYQNVPGLENGGLYLFLNTSKKSITLDLKTEEGRNSFQELAASADAIIENFRPGVMSDLDLDYESIKRINPNIVFTSISNFGQVGPYRDFKMDDIVAVAMAGWMNSTGEPNREPLKPGGYQAQFTAGVYAAMATLTAVFHKEATGKGQHVDVNIFDCAVSVLPGNDAGAQAFIEAYDQSIPVRTGRRRPHYPSTILPCKDGYMAVVAWQQKHWEAFCAWMGKPELMNDPKFVTAPRRRENADELDAIIVEWMATRTQDELYQEAQELMIPFGKVMNAEQIVRHPNFIARKYFIELEHPTTGKITYPGAPFRFGDLPYEVRPAPRLGEHNPELGTFFRDDNKVNHAPDKETRTQALKGIRILDLSMWWSGPRATRLLAEAGAEVFKIESPYYPDPWRVAGLAQAEQKGILDRFKPEDRINVSPNFNIENTNKFSLTLDLTLDRGKEILLKLAETCDIVVENYSPRVMKNFGLSYETFQNVNHDIILVSMPAFGLSGPDLNHVAFGATLEAMMGITYITGYRNEDPMCLSGTAYTDPICGINTALAMLMALRYRNLTGEGLHVEVAQLESVMPFVSPMIMDYTMNGHIQERIGNQHAWKAPHGCYRCKGNDAWITISIATEEEWKQFCQAIKRPELATQDRFSERRKRWQNQDELNALIEAWTLSLEPYEAMKLLQSYGIASGPVLNAKQLVKDPQRLSNIRNMGFYRANRHPVTGVPCEFISHPRLSETAVGIERPAPCFGEHNKYILEKMLHFTEQDIKKLREEKVISDVLLVD